MKTGKILWSVVLSAMMAAVSYTASAGRIQVAVASNFVTALEVLAGEYTEASGHEVVLASGSTGKQYAQIIHGAPFDLFFAADAERPRLLDEAGATVAGTRFTYALGRLVLWSPLADYVDARGEVLAKGDYRHLALANPDLAPYGAAARQVLRRLGLWEGQAERRVLGENIAQTFQFVTSGNAELGFVALSQLTGPDGDRAGSRWEVPVALYPPIEQQAVLLRDSPAARGFIEFIKSERGRELIRVHGYATP